MHETENVHVGILLCVDKISTQGSKPPDTCLLMRETDINELMKGLDTSMNMIKSLHVDDGLLLE